MSPSPASTSSCGAASSTAGSPSTTRDGETGMEAVPLASLTFERFEV